MVVVGPGRADRRGCDPARADRSVRPRPPGV